MNVRGSFSPEVVLGCHRHEACKELFSHLLSSITPQLIGPTSGTKQSNIIISTPAQIHQQTRYHLLTWYLTKPQLCPYLPKASNGFTKMSDRLLK